MPQKVLNCGLVRGYKPIRTCAGCGERRPATDLVRFVAEPSAHGNKLTLDLKHRLPGRGVWLHTSNQCAQMAIRRNAFNRVLRVSGKLETIDALQLLDSLNIRTSTKLPDMGV